MGASSHSKRPWIVGSAAVSLAALSAGPRVFAQAPSPLPASAPSDCCRLPDPAAGRSSAMLADPGHTFAHEGVVGTSMELHLRGLPASDAQLAHQAVLAEIDRLTAILSTRDPNSPIRQHMAGGPIGAPEITRMLSLYRQWSMRTGGIITPLLGGLNDLWKAAQSSGWRPSREQIGRAMERMNAGDLRLLNIDAMGKGFVIDRAAAVARRLAPAGLINIGGDIAAWGDVDWRIGVADPHNPADNAPPLTSFILRNGAVASSGGYLRNYTVAGHRYSHIVDPRTGLAIDPRNCATIAADDCVTANALSTGACILGRVPGAELAQAAGARGLAIIDGDGATFGGEILEPQIVPVMAPTQWPDGYQVTIGVNLKSPPGRRAKRPYVAVWVEDAQGKVIKTVSLWGTNVKYLKDMRHWVRATNGGDRKAIDSVGRASRNIGNYTVVWDGTDDAGKAVPKGKYIIAIEVNREHGRDAIERTPITCEDKPLKTKMKPTAESEEGPVEYGPKPRV